MFSLGIIGKLFNKGRLNEDSFLNYYEDVLVSKDGLVVILIDMQQFFIEVLKRKDKKRIIANQIFIIRWCAQKNIPMVVLEYEGCGKTINALTKELKRIKDLKTISKPHDNGFYNTELDYILNKIGAKNLFLMGINASVCVKSTAEGAIGKGFNIITSNDVIVGGYDGNNSIPWYKKNGIVISTKDSIRV